MKDSAAAWTDVEAAAAAATGAGLGAGTTAGAEGFACTCVVLVEGCTGVGGRWTVGVTEVGVAV